MGICFDDVGFNLPLQKLFLIPTFVGAAYLIPVPLALGTMKMAQVSLMSLLGLPAGVGVLMAMINRIRDLLWVPVGSLTLLLHGLDIKKILGKLWVFN